MTSLLLLQFACRRKYKSPNMLSSTSVFLGLLVKAVSLTLAMEKIKTPGTEQQIWQKCWVEE